MKHIIPVILGVLAYGCANIADFLESSTNAKILAIASAAGASALTDALGSKVTPDQQIIIQTAANSALQTGSTSAVWWFAEWLRTKQSTPQAAKAGAIAAGGVPLPVATAVTALASTGVPADKANEVIAMTVQTVAANK